jgi:glycine/D-amino acid oxidase-like deaminating enzyme
VRDGGYERGIDRVHRAVAGEPFWWEEAPRPDLPAPPLPAAADVAIVGSGYTGLSAALALARAGRSVVVFDAEDLGWGASSRNAGVLGSRLKISFTSLAKTRGLPAALAIYGEARDAFNFVVDLIRREAIECRLVTHGRFMGARTPADFEAMTRDADRMRKHLGVEAQLIQRAEQHREVGTDLYYGGVIRSLFGGLHPGLYHQGLLDRVRQTSAVLAPRTRVVALDSERNGFFVTTSRATVWARDVVIATNGYTGALTPWLRRRVMPVPSQIIVTEPLGHAVMDRLLPQRRMMGDSSKLHHYYRPSPDGLRIMFGGRAGFHYLFGEMVKLFPELSRVRITHSWSGYTGYTFDTMPHIGVHEGMHYAMGFCGSGVSMGSYLGWKVAQRILGSSEGATALDEVSFPTRPFYTGRPWFLPLAIAYYGLRDKVGR